MRVMNFARRIRLPLVLFARAAYAGEPSVAFLEGDAGRAAIVDESIEPYFSLLRSMEMATKTGKVLEAKDLPGQRDECRQRYRDAVRDFTAEEEETLITFARKIHSAWADKYPLFANTPWSFVSVASTMEGGMPHTRGRSIVMPEKANRSLAQLARANPRLAEAIIVELLVHEQAHVVQRLHPAVFEALYTVDWGFVRARGLVDGEWLESRQVVNPDGVDTGWLFPAKGSGAAYIQPFLILSDGPEPRSMPGDFVEIGVSVEKSSGGFRVKTDAERRPAFQPLADARDYQDRFGAVDQLYHPNEIFACFFSKMVARDHFGGPGLAVPSEVVGPDFRKLRSWCREHFAAGRPGGTK